MRSSHVPWPLTWPSFHSREALQCCAGSGVSGPWLIRGNCPNGQLTAINNPLVSISMCYRSRLCRLGYIFWLIEPFNISLSPSTAGPLSWWPQLASHTVTRLDLAPSAVGASNGRHPCLPTTLITWSVMGWLLTGHKSLPTIITTNSWFGKT